MEVELQELRELVAQLRVDNERLCQGQAAAVLGPSDQTSDSSDGALRRELMQYVRRQPTATLLDVRSEAIRWEREGLPGGSRGRSQSVPSAFGLQYGVQGSRGSTTPLMGSELAVSPCPGVGKLVPTGLQSHSPAGVNPGSVGVLELMSACPHVNVSMGGVQVPCLVDTGSMVSTVTESWFLQNLQPWGHDRLRSCNWLKLKAANGLAIPYVGYLELDVKICGTFVPRCGVLVVRDHLGEVSSEVPGILGMNIIRRCYHDLFGQHGQALFNLPSVTEAPWSVTLALQMWSQQPSSHLTGKVKVRGRKACRIRGGTMKIVVAMCSEQFSGRSVLFEPSENGLPAGLLASPALVRVVRGTAYILIVNVGTTSVLLYPRTIAGTLDEGCIVSMPAGVIEVPTSVATSASQAVSDVTPDLVEAIDLSALPVEDQGRVQSLLRQYASVFSSHEGDLGCTSLISHDIPLLDDVPVRQRHRRIPPYEVVKEHINQLLEAQIIRESSSPYGSPIVLVKKKDGSLRMCVDYRQLNNKTRKDAFPLPRIEESLDALTGARWFSTLDLASGYNQVPVTEADRPKTAFCTPFGLFEWNRMPFGLCNAPSTFQRLMQRLFGDQQCQSLLLYLDDIVVFSSMVEQHLERLKVVLGRLQEQGLKARLEKCAFFRREVRYLGHLVSDQGVSTDPSKIEVVANWPTPATVTELRSFLGLASYYRHFVEGFAKLAAPLHQLVANLNGPQRPSTSYLEELVTPYQPNKPLRSQNAGLPVVPRVSRGRMGGRAFRYQPPPALEPAPCPDDVVLLASSARDQRSLDWFAAVCEAAGMRISTSKSEAMDLNWKKVDCLVRVKEEILPQVEEFKYLGVLFTSEGRMEQEIDRQRELSQKAKLSIYRSIFVPTLTYGHELWVMTKGTRSRVPAVTAPFPQLPLVPVIFHSTCQPLPPRQLNSTPLTCKHSCSRFPITPVYKPPLHSQSLPDYSSASMRDFPAFSLLDYLLRTLPILVLPALPVPWKAYLLSGPEHDFCLCISDSCPLARLVLTSLLLTPSLLSYIIGLLSCKPRSVTPARCKRD
ncbi:Retrovirus-related Pol polyprotein from transposon 17.6 [Takifugu flavidus]|uniref:ribonuclease H n=1 Tax=Takifugu flavidus TaxID=433684 RepID=A0A5C6PG87_9TELE|nr:Retrovirus-related Pol polyprotein from transposon 17.6 [Takifugu flavidus]